MRKSLIFTFIAVIIFATGYLATSYYMGLQAKAKISELVRLYNSNIIRSEVKSYTNNIFRSNGIIEIQYEDYGPLDISFEIFHAPIFSYRSIDGSSKIYLFNLLVDTTVSEVFLQQKKILLNNTSVISLHGPIKINFESTSVIKDLYQAIGLSSNDNNYNSAIGQAIFYPNSIEFIFNGKGVDQYSSNKIYNIANSEFKININLFIKQDLWRSQVNLYVAANNITSKSKADTKSNLLLSDPKININYSGELAQLIDLIKNKNNPQKVIALLSQDQPINLSIELKNKLFEIVNKKIGDFKIDNFNYIFNFGNLTNKISLQAKVNFDKASLKTKTDNYSIAAVNLFTNMTSDKKTLKINNDFTIEDFFKNFPKEIYTDYDLLFEADGGVSFTNLQADGLSIGKLNIDKLNLNFSHKKENNADKNADYILAGNIDMHNFILHYNDNNIFDINLADFDIQETTNITKYLRFINDPSESMYNIELKSKVIAPKIIAKFNNKNINLNKFICNMDFKLNPKINGYLKANLQLDNMFFGLNAANDSKIDLNLNNIGMVASMKQEYKNLLTGSGSFNIDNISLLSLDNNFTVKNLQAKHQTQLNNNYLSYINNLIIKEINYNKINLGYLSFNQNIKNINAEQYIEFISGLMAEDYDDLLQKKINLLNNFLAQGMDMKNYLQIDSVNSNLKLESFLKINTSKSNDVQKSENFALGSKIALSKNYLDQIINIVDNGEFKKQMVILQKIGLLDYKNDTAIITMDYKNNEFIINNKPIQFWSEKYDNAQIEQHKAKKKVKKKSQ